MSDLKNKPNNAENVALQTNQQEEPDSVGLIIFWLIIDSALFVFMFWFFLVAIPNPITNPSMDDIRYTKGRVTVSVSGYRNNGKASHVKMKTDDGQRMHFTCNHSTMTYTQYSGCEGGQKDEEFKAEVQGKYAEVGWYQPKPFLGFKESRPRMVAFKIQQSDGTWVEKMNLEHSMQSMRVMSMFCIAILACLASFFCNETKKDFRTLFQTVFRKFF